MQQLNHKYIEVTTFGYITAADEGGGGGGGGGTLVGGTPNTHS